MEVVVMWQRVSRHVDAGFVTLETRVTVVANRLHLLIHAAKPNILIKFMQIINSEMVRR